MKRWNDGKPYDQQIRPFGFLLAFMPKTGLFAEPEVVAVDWPEAWPPSQVIQAQTDSPVQQRSTEGTTAVFDRVTGERIQPEQLKTYAEVLAQYHLSPEGKFANGQFLDRGRTERRHVVATDFALIGKEANLV